MLLTKRFKNISIALGKDGSSKFSKASRTYKIMSKIKSLNGKEGRSGLQRRTRSSGGVFNITEREIGKEYWKALQFYKRDTKIIIW